MPDQNKTPAERTTSIFGEDPSVAPKLTKDLLAKVLAKRAALRRRLRLNLLSIQNRN